MSIVLSTRRFADFQEQTFPSDTRDLNIGYGTGGVNSNPSDTGTFKGEMTDKIVNWIRLISKKRKMFDALDLLKPSEGMGEWTGDAQSPPLQFPGQKGLR